MKNIIILSFFSLLSLISLVIMILLAFLPKLCFCFNSFCNKNYKKIKLQNTRARRIKRARLRLMYKSQVSHEQPIRKEIDRSEGVFFDDSLKQTLKDEASLACFRQGGFEKNSVRDVVKNHIHSTVTFAKHYTSLFYKKMRHQIFKAYSQIRVSIVPLQDSLRKNSWKHINVTRKTYYIQVRSYVTTSLTKYLDH